MKIVSFHLRWFEMAESKYVASSNILFRLIQD